MLTIGFGFGRMRPRVTFWVFMFLSLVTGCDSSKPDSAPVTTPPESENRVLLSLDSLTLWTAEVQLTIGRDELEGQEFVTPIPLGADEAGNVYILDQNLRDVRRFDAEGRFEEVIVRPGQGPGEMGSLPWTSGLERGFIWYSELGTGRVHFLPLGEGEPYTEDTGWTPYTASGERRSVYVFPTNDRDGYIVRTEADVLLSGLRPRRRIQYLRTAGPRVEKLYEFETSGSTIFLDGGRTMVGYPGPKDHTVVFYDEESREILRIDRPTDSTMWVL